MNSAEFDGFTDEYEAQHRANIAISGEAPEYFARYKIQVLKQLAKKLHIQPGCVLDFGSGIGNSLPHFHDLLPDTGLVCADVSQRSLELSSIRFPGLANTVLIEGDRVPVNESKFDVTFSACVFHHIPHDEHVHWLNELHRVTRPGGMLTIFEHNPLNPLTVRAVNTCPFDANACLIRAAKLVDSYKKAGWPHPQVRYHVFFPRALSALRSLEPCLSRVVFGAQYSVTAIKQH